MNREINPIYTLIFTNLTVKVFLSDIRNIFRKWLINTEKRHLAGRLYRDIVKDFIEDKDGLNCKIDKRDISSLVQSLKGDMDKRMSVASKMSDFFRFINPNSK
jgi:hypothetical protein